MEHWAKKKIYNELPLMVTFFFRRFSSFFFSLVVLGILFAVCMRVCVCVCVWKKPRISWWNFFFIIVFCSNFQLKIINDRYRLIECLNRLISVIGDKLLLAHVIKKITFNYHAHTHTNGWKIGRTTPQPSPNFVYISFIIWTELKQTNKQNTCN